MILAIEILIVIFLCLANTVLFKFLFWGGLDDHPEVELSDEEESELLGLLVDQNKEGVV